MSERFFKNKFPDFTGSATTFELDKESILVLICTYVDYILKNCSPESRGQRGDLYVGNAGIAYMFWKLARCDDTAQLYPNLQHAAAYVKSAKAQVKSLETRPEKRYSFLCGNAGIYAVAAAINSERKDTQELSEDLKHFRAGIASCLELPSDKYGCDEILVGRAGYLAGCYWLNDVMPQKVVSDDELVSIAQKIIASGINYSNEMKSVVPLLYHYHGTEYLGAAHGLTSIYHMLLESPYYKKEAPVKATADQLSAIKVSVDFLVQLQEPDGGFPISMEDLVIERVKRLVHWCHGAPGIVYLLAKAYLLFKNERYLKALRKSCDLIWSKGLLRKGPGICHGVAGNGYAFLLAFRLTNDFKYLHRAHCFMKYLTDEEFKAQSRVPDRPYSLYEGVAGTVCFLVDLLNPYQAQFPFMDVFHIKE